MCGIDSDMIKKFLSDALLSIVMDKQAKDNYRDMLEHKKAVATAIAAGKAMPPPASSGAEPTPERAELIRQALAVHRDKSSVLDELTVADRQKLYTLAEKAMLGKNRG